MKKILAVADRAVNIKEIGEALYRDSQLGEETGGEFSLAPLRILKLAVLTSPGIEEQRPGWLVDRSGTACADVLSGNELRVYEFLSARGGVAPTEAMVRLVALTSGQSLRAQLALMPFTVSPAAGVYALRGWRISKIDLLAALVDGAGGGKEGSGQAAPTILVIRPHSLFG